uniref:hypothetical protein n=1 Tax=Flavobacterium sp. TaxID=239 RepID=UPI0015EEAE4F|nr:hypothetical protein [Flavobacterium sp.]
MKLKIYKLLILSALLITLNACSSTKVKSMDNEQEYMKDKDQEEFDNFYNEQHQINRE